MVNQERLWNYGVKPLVLAHRGGGNEAPENSISAFANMEKLGFKYIETDAHASRDGVVILFHDNDLSRTTNSSGKISRLSWKQISQVADESGNTPMKLADVLERFPDVVLNVDAKEFSVVPHLARVIKEHNAVARISLSAFSEIRLRILRRKLPGIRSTLGPLALVPLIMGAHLPVWLQNIFFKFIPTPEQGVECVQVPESYAKIQIINKKFIDACHARQQAVHVWTVNNPEKMRELLDLGVDGLITDEPSLAQRVIDDFWEKTV